MVTVHVPAAVVRADATAVRVAVAWYVTATDADASGRTSPAVSRADTVPLAVTEPPATIVAADAVAVPEVPHAWIVTATGVAAEPAQPAVPAYRAVTEPPTTG